jgi:hypothetical protein
MTTSHSEASNPRLGFDEAAHRYYLDGVYLPSVTTVLAAAGLIDYSFLGDRREQYLVRGRAVHLATQRDDEGCLVEESLDAEIPGYLQAWRSFRRDFGFIPQFIEHRVCNPRYGYAGTLDRTGVIRDGSEFILDIKTGEAPYATRYQVSAYSACLPHPRARLRRSVELHQDGRYRVIAYQTSSYSSDLNVFLAALELFKTKEEIP